MDVKNGAYMCNLRFVDGKRHERDGVLLGDILRDREIKKFSEISEYRGACSGSVGNF